MSDCRCWPGSRRASLVWCWVLLSGYLLLILLLPVVAGAAPPQQATQRSFTLGVLPYLIPRNMAQTYGPAVADINRQTGLNIHLRTTSNFPRFADNLRSQQYDFVVVQPFDFIAAVDELNYRPLARISIYLESILVVAKESPLHTLQDLKGKVIAMAPKPAATSRMGRVLLKESGLIPGKDVTIQYLNSHDSCLQEVLNRRADACMTGPPPMRLFAKRTGVQMRILAKAPSIPHIALLAHSRVDAVSAGEVQKVVTSWMDNREGRAILKKMAFPGWIPAQVEDYQDVRRILEIDQALQKKQSSLRELHHTPRSLSLLVTGPRVN